MESSFGWVFPALCLAMMVLCFLTFGRRAGRRGRFNSRCFGVREREPGSREGIEREMTRLQDEIDALRRELNAREESR
jgi:hypothetical protein